MTKKKAFSYFLFLPPWKVKGGREGRGEKESRKRRKKDQQVKQNNNNNNKWCAIRKNVYVCVMMFCCCCCCCFGLTFCMQFKHVKPYKNNQQNKHNKTNKKKKGGRKVSETNITQTQQKNANRIKFSTPNLFLFLFFTDLLTVQNLCCKMMFPSAVNLKCKYIAYVIVPRHKWPIVFQERERQETIKESQVKKNIFKRKIKHFTLNGCYKQR